MFTLLTGAFSAVARFRSAVASGRCERLLPNGNLMSGNSMSGNLMSGNLMSGNFTNGMLTSGLLAFCSLSGCAGGTDDLFGGSAGLPSLGGSSPSRGTIGLAGAGGRAGGMLDAGQGGQQSGGTGGVTNVATAGSGSGSGPGAGPGGAPAVVADAGAVVVSPPTCDPCPCSVGPFGAPELVTGLGIDGESFGPALSADSLTLFFSSIGVDENIFFATRESRSAGFTSAASVSGLDVGGSEEGTPFLSFDGRSLYFFSTRPNADAIGGRDVWLAPRPSDAAPFAEPFVVPVINGGGLDHLPRLSQDELTLMFVSGRESPNAFSNIWVSERSARSENFSAPVELEGINTGAREEGFSLSADGLALYFASNRVAESDMDIWVATRPTVGSPFGAIENLSVVNTPGADIDPMLSADGFELFFASNRSGAVQLYRSARICP